MTVNEALQNIDIVVANARMNRQEHDSLRESVRTVALKCKRADELEQIIKNQKAEKEKEENNG